MLFCIAIYAPRRFSWRCRWRRRRIRRSIRRITAISTKSVWNTGLTCATKTRIRWARSSPVFHSIYAFAVIAIIIFVIYFRCRRIHSICILSRATFATGLPWPIADLQFSIVMQPRQWIVFDHQGTQLFDTFAQKTLVKFRAIIFMWEIGCDVLPISGFREWTYCVDAKLLGIFLRNRLHRLFLIGVCGVHGPRCQGGDGDYVYSYTENYIKILIDTIESWSNRFLLQLRCQLYLYEFKLLKISNI